MTSEDHKAEFVCAGRPKGTIKYNKTIPRKFRDLISQCIILLLCRYMTPAQHSLAMRSLMPVGRRCPSECTEELMQDSSTLGIDWL